MFDDTNGYGDIPDALPQSYGYADREQSTVHQNMETALSSNPFNQVGANQMVVAANPAAPTVQANYHGGMPAGPVVGVNPHAPRQAAPPRANFGAATGPKSIPIHTDAARSLEYRDYDGSGGYRYRQYEDGRYAIIRIGRDIKTGKSYGLPSRVQLNTPFSESANPKAFNAIKAEVENAIGPFPGRAAPATVKIAPGSKAPPKAPETSSSGGGGGYTPSGVDTSERIPEEKGEDSKDKTQAGWFKQSTLGVPHWGWIAGVAVVAIGAGTAYYLTQDGTPAAPKPPAGG